MAIQINGNGTITGINVGGLPDGIVDTDMIANSAVTTAKSSGLGGLNMVDIWDLNHVIGMSAGSEVTLGKSSTYNGGTGQWTRATYNGTIGSAMTVSNEVFTFPSTGIYEILFSLDTWNLANAEARYIWARIYTSTNSGTNWTQRSVSNDNAISDGSHVYTTTRASYIFDVTNTSTHKIKFTAAHERAANINGDASGDNNLHTYVMFKKLGDT